MSMDLVDSPATPIPRDKWKRPLVVPPGGGKPTAYTRCTRYVDCLDDKYTLQLWQKRMVALGLAARPDLLLAVASTDRDSKEGKETLNRLTDQAADAAQANAAATTGTALHALTERLDRGRELGPVPAAYRADIDAYVRATAELEHLAIEQFVVNDEIKVGGTPDRVVMYGGRGYIADLKTGSVDYPAKFAMQLAVYARSQPYDHVTTTRSPYPVEVDTERGIIIHSPAGEGRCALYWLDLAAGWDGVRLAGWVRKWRRRTNLLSRWRSTVVDEPVDTVGIATAATVGYSDITTAIGTAAKDPALTGALLEITCANNLAHLREIYTRLVESGVDGNAILPTCLARKAELEDAA